MPQVKPGTEGYKTKEAPQTNRYLEIKDMYYNMNHKHRGLALIFNHESFTGGISARSGTNKDRDLLFKVLTNLGFRIRTKNNLNYEGIYREIGEVAQMDHSQNDCLLITVLTHGELGMLHASDIKYNIKRLWCRFTDDKCPTLAGKPKIFFIQACRGEEYDDGIKLKDKIEIDGSSGMSDNPMHPDFLFAFSTVPGYYSWRNSTNGSWFIQSLCELLVKYATDTQILTVLTHVNRKVAVEYESYTDAVSTNEKKQMCSIHTTLTRLLIFPNKSKKQEVNCCTQS